MVTGSGTELAEVRVRGVCMHGQAVSQWSAHGSSGPRGGV